MNNITLEINLKEGFGEIKFGEIPENVTKLLGEPTTAEEISTDDDLKTTILSFENGVTVFLEGLIEPIVSNFDVDNKSALLFGEKVFELKETGIIELMKKNGFPNMEREEEEWGELRLTFDEAMVDFYFEDDILVAVNWGVVINEGGTID